LAPIDGAYEGTYFVRRAGHIGEPRIEHTAIAAGTFPTVE